MAKIRENQNAMSKKDKNKYLDQIESKANLKVQKATEFENGVYFKHFTINRPEISHSKRLLAKAKINGEFKMKVPASMPPNERVTALAHENLAYYMHQKGNFFKIARKKPDQTELLRNKSIERI